MRLLNTEEQKIVYECYEQLGKPTGRKKVLPELLKIKDKIYYQIAVIYLYHNKFSNDKENLKNSINSEIAFNQAEFILALLGLYYGYKILRPLELISIKEKQFSSLIGEEQTIKFRLNSELDYLTIETIYQFTFNSKSDNTTFEYLPSPQAKISHNLDSFTSPIFRVETSKNVFGVDVFEIHKISEFEVILKEISNFPEKLDLSYLISSYIQKYLHHRSLIRLNGIVFKSEFLKVLEEEGIDNFEFINYCIQGDKKFNQ